MYLTKKTPNIIKFLNYKFYNIGVYDYKSFNNSKLILIAFILITSLTKDL